MKSRRILFLLHHPIQDGSSRYRIYQFLPILERNGFNCVVKPFTTPWLFKAIRNKGNAAIKSVGFLYCTLRRALDLLSVRRYDLIVIHREAYPFFTPAVEKLILRLNPKAVFSFDDAIFIGHDRTKHKYSFLYRFKYGPGASAVIERSSLVIAGSQILADYARQYNSRVVVLPTVVDTEVYQYRSPVSSPEDRITIGWYGSDSTSPYLCEVLPALERLAHEHGDTLRFRFFGDPRLRLPLPNCEIRPFRLESELSDLRSIDIGLMPLTDTPWTRAKCAFKAIQYMALGIPTVVSPHGMARDLIEDGRNGFHARTVHEWYEALNRLIKDRNLRVQIAEAGRQTIVERYSLQRWGQEFVGVLESALSTQPPGVTDSIPADRSLGCQ